jgi:predicted GTPase
MTDTQTADTTQHSDYEAEIEDLWFAKMPNRALWPREQFIRDIKAMLSKAEVAGRITEIDYLDKRHMLDAKKFPSLRIHLEALKDKQAQPSDRSSDG